jgi:hypothetical protein
VLRHTFDEVLGIGPDDTPQGGEISQKGAGAYTLCPRCNNNTGSWYGHHFVEWCHQGMHILERSGGKPSLIYLNYVFPLSIIKQIATMFFSVHGLGFRRANPELERFVLNREARFLSPRHRFFAYFNIEGRTRYSPTVGLLNTESGKWNMFTELTYPPYGYVMTYGEDPPHEHMFEITHFSRYKYGEFDVLQLRLPVLPTFGSMPGDYRTREEIYREAGLEPPSGDV